MLNSILLSLFCKPWWWTELTYAGLFTWILYWQHAPSKQFCSCLHSYVTAQVSHLLNVHHLLGAGIYELNSPLICIKSYGYNFLGKDLPVLTQKLAEYLLSKAVYHLLSSKFFSEMVLHGFQTGKNSHSFPNLRGFNTSSDLYILSLVSQRIPINSNFLFPLIYSSLSFSLTRSDVSQACTELCSHG